MVYPLKCRCYQMLLVIKRLAIKRRVITRASYHRTVAGIWSTFEKRSESTPLPDAVNLPLSPASLTRKRLTITLQSG
ncbi:hypothetical protein C1O30_03370 [Dickeya zeae]|nr:hypothetical protein C1O30_03370 [Dickeya zeae]